MCIIANIRKGTVSEERFNEMWNRNPHGFGMMWTTMDGVIHNFKSQTLAGCYNRYIKASNDVKRVGDIVLHFRIATQGAGIENTHPFYVADDLWFCHNGIISQWSTVEDEKTGKSDTRLFAEYVLKKFDDPKMDIHNPAIRELVEEYISTDKLVFLDDTGTSTIYNEHYGIWDDGNWYSNNSFKPIVVTPPTKTPTKRYTYSIKCDCCGSSVTAGQYTRLTRGTTTEIFCDDCLELFMGAEIIDYLGNK